MAENSSHQDIISAADKTVGFDYQFYYFFYLIIGLRHGEKVGLEVKDDLHVDLANGKTVLIQTKHSIQTKADGDPINIYERDKDLWKTLSNWTKIINEQTDKASYLNKTTFQLITNKSEYKNPFIANVLKVQNKDLTISDFKKYLKNLSAGTSDVTIIGYIDNVSKLNNPLLESFIKNLQFELNVDNLIDKIKIRLLEKINISEWVDDIYSSLHSELRDKNYLDVKLGLKFEMSFDDFNTNFRGCFKKGLNSKLPIRELSFTLPENPRDQLFINQLIEIGDIDEDDKDIIIQYTSQMLRLYNNLNEWETKGELLVSDRRKFDDNTKQIWKTSFRAKYRDITRLIKAGKAIEDIESDINVAALKCLDEMRNVILEVDETKLEAELSQGHFYLLTQDKHIGWHYDWQNKYSI